MEDLKEMQRQKWQQKKEEEAKSAENNDKTSSSEKSGYETQSAVSPPLAPAASSQAVSSEQNSEQNGEIEFVRKVHILPFMETEAKIVGKSRFETIGPELRRMRAAKEIVTQGSLLRHDGFSFAVTNCEPAEGQLGHETDYFLDGPALIPFQKIQFSCWGPVEYSADTLFTEVIAPYFKGEFKAHGSAEAKKVRIFTHDLVFKIGEISVHVEALDPAGTGVVTTETQIFALWDKQAEFDKIHIVPFQDTLPRVYEYDIFNDYLKPYLDRNKHKKMRVNELFTYQGVQFKVVACEPNDAPARVGKSTTIYCDGQLHPSLRNLLPPELLQQVAQLPPGLQMLLLNTERTHRELEDMLSSRRGLFEDTLTQIESFSWPPANQAPGVTETCRVCIGDFENGESCRRLPCGHVFHAQCIDEWLRRCTDCPICRMNIDRAIRNY
jgi:hypothetical protein